MWAFSCHLLPQHTVLLRCLDFIYLFIYVFIYLCIYVFFLFFCLFIYLHPHGVTKLLANICILHRSPTTQNLCDHEFELSKPLKVKCEAAIGLLIYAFLLMFNSNIGPNCAPLGDIRLQNLDDLDFDVQSHSMSNIKVLLDSTYMVSH